MPIPPSVRAKVLEDQSAIRKEYIFDIPKALKEQLRNLLKDSRDLPVAILLCNILILVPTAVYFVSRAHSHLLGASFLLINYGFFLQRYLVALLHVTEHRQIFRNGIVPSAETICRKDNIAKGPKLQNKIGNTFLSVHSSEVVQS